MWLTEVELEAATVKLIPLRTIHAAGLVTAASDGELWDLWFTSVPNETTIEAYIANALAEQQKGTCLPFTIIDKTNNKIIGSTRFCHVDSLNNRVEIGYTWYSKSYQRTSVNTQCKQLLLSHAFETLNTIAVEFRTHWHNQKSREAIARLGAKQDGVLRNHQKVNGVYRDTVVFSIIDAEWPTVKTSLAYKLAKYD
ncbi:GNAT family N-acetyltransferase [Shewanella sp. OMA3-2]|uniref:GNAT family N-acetyltransferase n=1 Tax=Shewanella sp. OMA3-2 TaxID=2908650 RepID=UPI001F2726C0|nr:GNAT family protein [Shewanella sp. OMA3-2]UJF20549.1 GNAT family N-acetyltransferase [Shewanella sp. OMA3-2]